MLAPDVLKEVS